MNPDMARYILAALRRGDRRAQLEYFRSIAREAKADCGHCAHRTHPLARRFDFDALTFTFECELCGKTTCRALGSWPGKAPLQPPPAT